MTIYARAVDAQVELLEPIFDLDRALRVADLHELESELPAGRLEPARAVRVTRRIVLGRSQAHLPMSIVQSSPSMRGRISPAAVLSRARSCSVQPLRRRYIAASRTPFPDSSACEPSGL